MFKTYYHPRHRKLIVLPNLGVSSHESTQCFFDRLGIRVPTCWIHCLNLLDQIKSTWQADDCLGKPRPYDPFRLVQVQNRWSKLESRRRQRPDPCSLQCSTVWFIQSQWITLGHKFGQLANLKKQDRCPRPWCSGLDSQYIDSQIRTEQAEEAV
jgi:hypothetical protein